MLIKKDYKIIEVTTRYSRSYILNTASRANLKKYIYITAIVKVNIDI